MEEAGDPRFKRERPTAASFGQPPQLHMPVTDASHLHSYHHPTPQAAQMSQSWNPAPSPYHDANEHRQLPADAAAIHQQPPPPTTYPPHTYPPQPPNQTPTFPPDTGYSRQSSVSGPTRSPPNAQHAHYPPPMNGAPAPEGYYSSDYRNRPFPLPESPAATAQQPVLHVGTNHEMIPGPPQGQPTPGYPPAPPSAGPPPTPQHYWAHPPPGDWYQQQRRKPVRAAQACDSCRQRKAKCDEGRPECTHCKENGLRCTYRDVPPQKSEKQVLAITEKVDGLGDRVEAMGDRVEAIGEKLDALTSDNELLRESMRNQHHAIITTLQALFDSRLPDARTPVGNVGGIMMAKSRSHPQTKEEPQYDNTSIQGHAYINAPFAQPQAFEAAADQMPQIEVPEPTATQQRGPMSASDLLLWPSIRELAPPYVDASYVMDGELERGLLRLYGCGEGEDRGDGHDGAPSPSGSSSSGRMDEDVTSTASPSGVWGNGQFPQREATTHNSVYDHPGGVTPTGELLLDKTAVDKYVKSYLDRMHILHPFLDPRVLRKMVHAFKMKHSWDYGGVSRLQQSVGAGSKRKRDMSDSPNSITDEPPMHAIPHHNGPRGAPGTLPIEHSISNAIILLVLALGKICAHERSLPGPPKSGTIASTARYAQQYLGYGDLPPSSAPTSPFQASGTLNGTSTTHAGSVLRGKNMDVIPGLAYFAKAADILGELPGGVDVSHIQANLLAGLYMGQLARVIPSHWYILNACRACQILIRSKAYKNRTMSAERRNLINFAFWSCLQLESDILAEMDIPPSGIIHKEASMLHEIPSALTISDPESDESSKRNPQEFLRHYSNQIQLRRTINDAVHNIYNAQREQAKPTKLIETIGENLENWRFLLKDWDWDDDDHESTDINHARMRGKYYGAKYIINRPALHYALSLGHLGTPVNRPSKSPQAGGLNSEQTSPAVAPTTARRGSDMRPPVRPPEQLEDWVLAACQRCIHAAIKSTTAFDQVPARLIITNILGTAHA